MKGLEALAIIEAIGLGLGGHHPEPVRNKKVAPQRLQRTPEQVEELKRLAQEKRDRKAARLNRGKQ
jgi:hypothetical protein